MAGSWLAVSQCVYTHSSMIVLHSGVDTHFVVNNQGDWVRERHLAMEWADKSACIMNALCVSACDNAVTIQNQKKKFLHIYMNPHNNIIL